MTTLFFGDVFLDKKYTIDFNIDKCIFNLEYTITNSNAPAKDKVNLKCQKSFLLDSFSNSVEAVSLANNHIFDFKEEGFLDTINSLKKDNINYFGAGERNTKYNNPHIFSNGNKKIAILGYNCHTTNPSKQTNFNVAELNENSILKDILSIKQKVDFIVLYLHWGMEEIPFPKFSDTLLAKKFIDAGIDLIIGQHPHVIQGYEIYKNKYIFYSLGNFIFPDLNTNCSFDGEKFTNKYIKKQEKEHRSSIVVALDKNLNIDFFTVELKNNIIKKKKVKIPNYIPNSEYEFQKKLKIQRKKNMLKKLIRNPKLPNLEHFIRFFTGR